MPSDGSFWYLYIYLFSKKYLQWCFFFFPFLCLLEQDLSQACEFLNLFKSQNLQTQTKLFLLESGIQTSESCPSWMNVYVKK